jgi:hypothetical protein
MTMRYPDYRTIRGEGRRPLPDTRETWADRLSLWLAGETGLGMLIVAFALALFAAAFVWGMNVGYDMCTVSLSQQAQEVLR